MKDLKTRFCPKCGKEADRLFDGMCVGCLFEKGTIELPKRIAVDMCKRCCRYFFKGNVMESIEEVIEVEMKKHIESALRSPKARIKGMHYRTEGNKAYVSLKLELNGVQKSEEHEIAIIRNLVVCQYCSMASTRYYNSIIQIRGPEEKVEKAFNYAVAIIPGIKSDKMAFISDIQQTINGVDIYIGSKAAASGVAKIMKKKFGAIVKKTRKLAGRKKGREIYRDTILILIE